jgi:hypothetical protein
MKTVKKKTIKSQPDKKEQEVHPALVTGLIKYRPIDKSKLR